MNFDHVGWHPVLDALQFESINIEEAKWLERALGEEEVSNAVRSMDGDKVQGPNGYSIAFFQTCWEVVKRGTT